MIRLLVLMGVAGATIHATPASAAPAVASVPVVAPGGPVQVDVHGFAARTPVVVLLVGSRAGHRAARADADGRVRTSYPGPAAPGRYTVLVVGRARTTPGPGRDQTHGPGDHQVVEVTVPLAAPIPFRVGDSGVDGVGLGPPSGSSAGGSGTDGLAVSGTDLLMPLELAGALLLAGGIAVAAGRRRARR